MATGDPDQTAAADSIVTAISAELLAEVLRQTGFRVTMARRDDGSLELHSAAQGLTFLMRFGNAAASGQHSDFAFICTLAVEGTLDPASVEEWNRTRRFGRAYRSGQHLMLSLDVSVAGGVTMAHLRSQCMLWDRLLQEFLLNLQQLGKR